MVASEARRALAVLPPAAGMREGPNVAMPRSLGEVREIGAILAASGYFPDAASEYQAIAKILRGLELGLLPVQSLEGIYFIPGRTGRDGKPSSGHLTLAAQLMATLIQQSGRYSYRVQQIDEEAVVIQFREGPESVGVSSFTREDARTAGLLDTQTWRNYFRNMAWARAMSNGAKWFCASVFGGPVYTPEELGATVDGEGIPIEAEVLPPAVLHEPASRPADSESPRQLSPGETAGRIESAKNPYLRGQHHFWARATELGYDHDSAHVALGLPTDAGALAGWVHQLDGEGQDGWAVALATLERVGPRRAAETELTREPIASEAAAPVACRACGVVLDADQSGGYGPDGVPYCDEHLPFDERVEGAPAPMPVAAAIPVARPPREPVARRTFSTVPELLTAAHRELDLVPSQVDRILGGPGWRTRAGDRYAAAWETLLDHAPATAVTR